MKNPIKYLSLFFLLVLVNRSQAQNKIYSNLYNQPSIELNREKIDSLKNYLVYDQIKSESESWLSEITLDPIESISFQLLETCNEQNKSCIDSFFLSRLQTMEDIRIALFNQYPKFVAKSLPIAIDINNQAEVKEVSSIYTGMELLHRSILNLLPDDTDYGINSGSDDLFYVLDSILTDSLKAKKKFTEAHDLILDTIRKRNYQISHQNDRLVKYCNKFINWDQNSESIIYYLKNIDSLNTTVKGLIGEEIKNQHKSEKEIELISRFNIYYDTLDLTPENYKLFLKAEYNKYRNYFEQLGIVEAKFDSSDTSLIDIPLDSISLLVYADSIYQLVKNESTKLIVRPEDVFDRLHSTYLAKRGNYYDTINNENLLSYYHKYFCKVSSERIDNLLQETGSINSTINYLKSISEILKDSTVYELKEGANQARISLELQKVIIQRRDTEEIEYQGIYTPNLDYSFAIGVEPDTLANDSIVLVPIYWKSKIDTFLNLEVEKHMSINRQSSSKKKKANDVVRTIPRFNKSITTLFDNLFLGTSSQPLEHTIANNVLPNYIIFNTNVVDSIVIYWGEEPNLPGLRIPLQKLIDGDLESVNMHIESRVIEYIKTRHQTLINNFSDQIQAKVDSVEKVLYNLIPSDRSQLLKYVRDTLVAYDKIDVKVAILFDSIRLGEAKYEISLEDLDGSFSSSLDKAQLLRIVCKDFLDNKLLQVSISEDKNKNTTASISIVTNGNRQYLGKLTLSNKNRIELQLNKDLINNLWGHSYEIINSDYKNGKLKLSGTLKSNSTNICSLDINIGPNIDWKVSGVNQIYIDSVNQYIHENVLEAITIDSFGIGSNGIAFKLSVSDMKIGEYLSGIELDKVLNAYDIISTLRLDPNKYYTIPELKEIFRNMESDIIELIGQKAISAAIDTIESFLAGQFGNEDFSYVLSEYLNAKYIYKNDSSLLVFYSNKISPYFLFKMKRLKGKQQVNYEINENVLKPYFKVLGIKSLKTENVTIQYNGHGRFMILFDADIGGIEYRFRFLTYPNGKIKWDNQDSVLKKLLTKGEESFGLGNYLDSLFGDFLSINDVALNGDIDFSINVDLGEENKMSIKNIQIDNAKHFDWSKAKYNFDGIENMLNRFKYIKNLRIFHNKSLTDRRDAGELIIQFDLKLADEVINCKLIAKLSNFKLNLNTGFSHYILEKTAKYIDDYKENLKIDFDDYSVSIDTAKRFQETIMIGVNIGADNLDIPNCLKKLRIQLMLDLDGKLKVADGIDSLINSQVESCIKEITDFLLNNLGEWGKNEWFKVIEKELTYANSSTIKIPTGIRIISQLKIYDMFSVGLPPLVLDFNKGIQSEKLDRISFTMDQTIHVPPFALTDVGGTLSNKKISASGKLTLVDGTVKNAIYVEGSISVPLEGRFYLSQNGKLVLLNTLAFAESSDTLWLDPLELKFKAKTNEIIDDIIDIDINARYLDKVLSGTIDVSFLNKFNINGNLRVDQTGLMAQAEVDLILVTANAELKILVSPDFYARLTSEADLYIAGHTISKVKILIAQDIASVNFKFLGISLGAAVPSYKSLNDDLIWQLIKNLLSFDIDDIPKMLEAIFKGNLNINPFGDFGSDGDGIASDGGSEGRPHGSPGSDSTNKGNEPGNKQTPSKSFNRDQQHSFERIGIGNFDQISVEHLAALSRKYIGKEDRSGLYKAIEVPQKKLKNKDIREELFKGQVVKTFGGTVPGEWFKFSRDENQIPVVTAGEDTLRGLSLQSYLNANNELDESKYVRIRRNVNTNVVSFYSKDSLYSFSEVNRDGLKISLKDIEWNDKEDNAFWRLYDSCLEKLIYNYGFDGLSKYLNHSENVIIIFMKAKGKEYPFIVDFSKKNIILPRKNSNYDLIGYQSIKYQSFIRMDASKLNPHNYLIQKFKDYD